MIKNNNGFTSETIFNDVQSEYGIGRSHKRPLIGQDVSGEEVLRKSEMFARELRNDKHNKVLSAKREQNKLFYKQQR